MKWLKDIAKIILKEEILQLDTYILNLTEEKKALINENLLFSNNIIELRKANDDLKWAQIDCENSKENAIIEYFWNNKVSPVTILYYAARDQRNMNVIRFFNEKNDLVPSFTGSNDEIANKALKYVYNEVVYTGDLGENWQWANETILRQAGDCEDGAILMANIMLKSGIPYFRIRLNAGDVKGGGHAYVTYLREFDNKWYILDWCYWYTQSVNFKRTWKNAENYFGIWFSWNSKYGFKKDELDR